MKFEVRSVNTRYENGEVVSVQVNYYAKNETRSVSVNGYFELTAEEYAGNEAIERLEQLAKQHTLNEVNAE